MRRISNKLTGNILNKLSKFNSRTILNEASYHKKLDLHLKWYFLSNAKTVRLIYFILQILIFSDLLRRNIPVHPKPYYAFFHRYYSR